MTHAEIEDRAARYVIRRDEPEWSVADEAELQNWLSESMAHKAAFWRLEHGWRQADRIAALGSRARGGARRRWSRRQAWVLAAAAVFVGCFLAGVPLLQHIRNAAPEIAQFTYATPVGGRKVVKLGDGSSIELNTASRLRAAITDDQREAWLDSGEAFFNIAHNPQRPFVVHAGDRRITVLGTRFSVRVDAGQVSVSVLEGRVRLDPADQPSTPDTSTAPILSRGALAVARGANTLIAADAGERVDRALAWRHGMLSFDQSTLAEVVAEFNRYNTRPIVVADPEAAAIRIGGTFKSSNQAAFLRLLQSAYGLRVQEDSEKVTISS